MNQDWKLPEIMDKVGIPPDCILSYSQINQLLADEEMKGKVFDSCIAMVRDHLVSAALIKYRGNQSAAASQLDITRSTLRDYLKVRGTVKPTRLKTNW